MADGLVTVSFTLTNTGSTDGKETVQVYFGKSESAVERAAKELKGFTKVALKAGESKTVKVEVPVSELAYYDVESSDWQVESGTYQILVGASSRDIRGETSVSID